MNLLIIGATGFIGSHFIRYVHKNYPEVTLTLSCRHLDKGVALAEEVGGHFFCGDLLDQNYVQMICSDIDVIAYCGQDHLPAVDYDSCFRANVKSIELLLPTALDSGVQRLVYLSSASIYSDNNDHLNIPEDFLPARFVDNFARTQYQAETRVMRAHSEQLRVLVLRPHMVVGAGERNFFPKLVAAHQQDKLFQIGEGRNIISMTSIDNLVQALECAVWGGEEVTGDLYNIADPRPVNLWHSINQLMNALEIAPVSRKMGFNFAYSAAAANELWQSLTGHRQHWMSRSMVALLARSFTLNVEKARRKLGYHPRQNIEASIKAYAEQAVLADRTYG